MTFSLLVPMIKSSKKSTVFSNRITEFIKSTLLIPETTDKQTLNVAKVEYLLIVNGPAGFCGHLEQLASAVSRAKEVVYIQNDYTLPPPSPQSNAQSPWRKVFADRNLVPHYWTEVIKNKSATPKSRIVHWAKLGYRPLNQEVPVVKNLPVYYGAHRPGREGYFKQFFSDPYNPFVVSSTSEKFKEYRGAKPVDPPPDIIPWLAQFPLSILLMDAKTTRENHSTPSRFYEMVAAKVPICAPAEVYKMLSSQGIDVSPLPIVRAPIDVYALLAKTDEIRRAQQAVWNKDYTTDVVVETREAFQCLTAP